MSSIELWLCTDRGERLTLLSEFANLQYTIVLQEVGVLTVELPPIYPDSLFAKDRQIQVWRDVDGLMRLERAYLVRRILDATDKEGRRTIMLTGLDGNYLLDGPIVAYAAGSSEAEKTDYADDLMKAIVRENLGALATDADRTLDAGHFSVEADLSLGPSIQRAFAYRNVLQVLNDLSGQARTAGSEVYFDVASAAPDSWQFRTFTGQPGMDRRFPGGVNPILLSVETGALTEPAWDQDWTAERSVVYAGGQGEGADRVIVEREDTERSGGSIWSRREAFVDARNESTTAGVTAVADEELARLRPRRRFTARLISTPAFLYGRDWGWGDRVSASYQGLQHDSLVTAVRVRISESGLETVESLLEADE